MSKYKDYKRTDVLIVGAGPAGLAAAIKLKTTRSDIQVCVVDKGAKIGNHNLSGAVLEPEALNKLLGTPTGRGQGWWNSSRTGDLFTRPVRKEQLLFFAGNNFSLPITFAIKLAKLLGPDLSGQCKGDYIISVSRLCRYLADFATKIGVEVLTGFTIEDILLDEVTGKTTAVKLADRGRDPDLSGPKFVSGEQIRADIIILAEGCDGLVTEKFIEKAKLKRQANQLFSLGIKEVIKVSDEQYAKFGNNTAIHTIGYPLWTPVVGPAMFGNGVLYSYGENQITAAMIVALDYEYCDFNPQDALTAFKQHSFVKQFIADGQIVEAGAKMIPSAGYYAIPRDPATSTIGKANVLIVGDAAGFVNMLKIKGLHNAIESGILAGLAVAKSIGRTSEAAMEYTCLLRNSNVYSEMQSARKFRQTVAKCGNLFGLALSAFGQLVPKFKIEKDYTTMTSNRYKYKTDTEFDKAAFTALAHIEHPKDQRSHLEIIDVDICADQCAPKFNRPCITFCPAGVYEAAAEDQVAPANFSNCLHCKTCRHKCPFDNIRWTAPEGAGGPGYKQM